MKNWTISNKSKNNFGDLHITFSHANTDNKIESTFAEGEHHQADLMLASLNEEEQEEARFQAMMKQEESDFDRIRKSSWSGTTLDEAIAAYNNRSQT